VEQQLSDAITAMHNQDSELAKRVIDGDKQVNMMEVAIDEACVRIIAKRQPTASDLRLVMAIIKTIAELERIGDVADKICRTALEKFFQQHQPLLVSLEWAATPCRCCMTCWMPSRVWILTKRYVFIAKIRKSTRNMKASCVS
jgi:phosphate transport system protein